MNKRDFTRKQELDQMLADGLISAEEYNAQMQSDKNAFMLEFGMVTVREIALLFLAATSVIVVFVSVKGKMLQYVESEFLQSFYSSLAVIGVYMLVDWFLGILIPFAENMYIGKTKVPPALKAAVVVTIMILLGTTGAMSVITGKLLSYSAAPIPTTDDLNVRIETENATYNASLSRAGEELDRARQGEADAVRNAQREAKQLLDAAVAKYNKKEWIANLDDHLAYADRLKREGRLTSGSFKNWYEGIVSAKEQGASLIAEAKGKVGRLEATYSTLLQDGSTAKDRNINEMIKLKREKIEEAKGLQSTVYISMLGIDAFCVLAVIITTLFLIGIRKEYGIQVPISSGIAGFYLIERTKQLFSWLLKALEQSLGFLVFVFGRLILGATDNQLFRKWGFNPDVLKLQNTGVAFSHSDFVSSLGNSDKSDVETVYLIDSDAARPKSDKGYKRKEAKATKVEKATDQNDDEKSDKLTTGGKATRNAILFVDLKQDCDRIRQAWRRAVERDAQESQETGKAVTTRQDEILNDEETGIAWLISLGCTVYPDPENHRRLKIKTPKVSG